MKKILQVVVAIVMLAMGSFFFIHEKESLPQAIDTLNHAQPIWVVYGMVLTALYMVIQGLMYQYSYRAIGKEISLSSATNLYLKRNFVSVFLPAGLLTNMLFFNAEISRKEQVTRPENLMAASVFTVASIGSVFVLAFFVGFSWFIKTVLLQNTLLFIGFMMGLIFFIGLYSILHKNISYTIKLPAFAKQWLAPFEGKTINWRKAFGVLLLSIGIELIGIAHLFVAIRAVGASADWTMATMGYLMALSILMTSPLMRGIGAIEAVLTIALTHYGLATTSAISAALLFRVFEFWLLLVAGLVLLVLKNDNIQIRTAPSVLLAILGSINILSTLTPSIENRVMVLHEFLPLHWLHASHYLVVVSGIMMMGLSIYLWRGLRVAWLLSILLCGFSIIGNMMKGLDYEEALLAIVVLATLWHNRKDYFVGTDSSKRRRFILPILSILLSAFLITTYSFWILDERILGIDLTTVQSLKAAFRTMFLFDCGYQPLNAFGAKFLSTIYVLSASSILFIFYLIFKPFIFQNQEQTPNELLKARDLVRKVGNSSLDYFKTYFDKSFFFTEDAEAFIAYKATAQYAVCLENPVALDDASREKAVHAFDAFAHKNALRTIYYRIPEYSKSFYENLGKKTLPIGEEAIVCLKDFNLEGDRKASIRNSVNKMKRSGFVFKAYEAPQWDNRLQQLQAVSDEWLRDTKRTEIAFSQGIFNSEELKGQTLVTVENAEGKIFAFLNLIPDSRKQEANFDLMRKTADAPHGTMDFIFVNLFEYLKDKGYAYVNMGMVPLSGIKKPANLPERGLKIAYENLKRFRHYKGLRSFKEKFNPQWVMHYVVYDNVKDLIALPSVIEKVIEI